MWVGYLGNWKKNKGSWTLLMKCELLPLFMIVMLMDCQKNNCFQTVKELIRLRLSILLFLSSFYLTFNLNHPFVNLLENE